MIARREARQRPAVSIIDAMDDDHLFASQFPDAETWASWRVFLKCPVRRGNDRCGRELFRACTKRDAPNPSGHTEAWLVVGRRGGKSR